MTKRQDTKPHPWGRSYNPDPPKPLDEPYLKNSPSVLDVWAEGLKRGSKRVGQLDSDSLQGPRTSLMTNRRDNYDPYEEST